MLKSIFALPLALLLLVPASPAGDRCLMIHHDGTFEQPLYWDGNGVMTPYYGAFGEGYAPGYGVVVAAHLWLSQDGSYAGQTFDLYFWSGGVEGAPGQVIDVIPRLRPQNLPIWPEVGDNIYITQLYIETDITVGFWGNWPGMPAGFEVGADEEGIDTGHPWTNIAPGLPWPSGWQHPDVVWDYPRRHTESLGLGIDVDRGPSPVVAPTWGSVKSLFR